MMVVQRKTLIVNGRPQCILMSANAQILDVVFEASSNGMAFSIYYLNTGAADVERYFWVINTLQQVDDEKYGPFRFIKSVTTPRGLSHIFERF